jgi:hypothetical protein
LSDRQDGGRGGAMNSQGRIFFVSLWADRPISF